MTIKSTDSNNTPTSIKKYWDNFDLIFKKTPPSSTEEQGRSKAKVTGSNPVGETDVLEPEREE